MTETLKYVIQQNIVAGIVLALITCGVITEPSQIPGKVNKTEMNQLASVMEIENGSNGDECMLLTGSVVLNRINSKKWKGNTIEDVILAKEGKYWQYASVTRNGFKTRKPKQHSKLLAKYLLTYGPICPENVVYQGQSYNGSGLYKKIQVPGQKPELFCYE